jgi:UDP-N-acetylmuramyl tripeptide synthase
MENKNGLAFKFHDYFDQYKAKKEQLFDESKTQQLALANGSLQSAMQAKGWTISNTTPEMLERLGSQLGLSVLNNITTLHQKSVDDILTQQKDTMSQIGLLQ